MRIEILAIQDWSTEIAFAAHKHCSQSKKL